MPPAKYASPQWSSPPLVPVDSSGRTEHQYVPADLFAGIYAALGGSHRALEWLQRAYDERSWALIWIAVALEYDGLRSEPRFQHLLRHTSFPEADSGGFSVNAAMTSLLVNPLTSPHSLLKRDVCIVVPLRITGASLNSDTDRLTTALADRYRIEHELGAGGMATVYLAHDVKHNRKVAVKVLRSELAQSVGADQFL